MIPKRRSRTGERIMKFLKTEGWEQSEELARERGVFPHYPGSRYDH